MRFPCVACPDCGRWQKDFIGSLIRTDAALEAQEQESISDQESASGDAAVLQHLQTAARAVNQMIAGGVAPLAYWPQVLQASVTSGLWSTPVPLLPWQDVQAMIVAVEVPPCCLDLHLALCGTMGHRLGVRITE